MYVPVATLYLDHIYTFRKSKTILWNDLTIKWIDLTWNNLTMKQNYHKPIRSAICSITFEPLHNLSTTTNNNGSKVQFSHQKTGASTSKPSE